MTVYIEYVLLDNFVIDFLLIRAVAYVTNSRQKKVREVLGATFGSIFALFMPLLNASGILLFIIKLSGGIIIVFIAFKYTTFKQEYVLMIAFISLSFLVGGAITGIYSLYGIQPSTDFCIAITILPIYLIFLIIKRVVIYFAKRVKLQGYCYKVEMVINGNKQVFNGFLDTGNIASVGSQPIVFASKKAFLSLMDFSERGNLTSVNFNTINGVGSKKALKNQTLKIYFSDKPNIFNNVIIAVSESVIDGYDFILNSLMVGERINEQADKGDIKSII